MARWWGLVTFAWVAACRPSPGDHGASSDASSLALAAERDGSQSQVELTWRLFETQHWLDGDGPHQSAIFELLVDGGVPSRVQLGRRDSSGCMVGGEIDGGTTLASLDCSFAHAEVRRASGGELRVEAFDLDVAHPDRQHERRNVHTEIVRVPVAADVSVSRELARIPDEAVPGTSVR